MAEAILTDWDAEKTSAFQNDKLIARHNLHELDLFTDEGLIELLDTYPRDKLGVYTFPPHAEGRVEARHGRAPDIGGADLLEAVRAGRIWLNLRAVNQQVAAHEGLGDSVFGPLEAAAGIRTLKRDIGVLISSPGIHVHYHLDIPLVCLVHLRGEKTLYVYPPRPPFAPLDQIEAVALREREEDIAYRDDFEAEAAVFALQPGQAITWPQNAPHRIQNGDSLNVSLSCEFMTPKALLRANAIYTNGVLRRSLKMQPRLPETVGPGLLGKAVVARGLKALRRGPAPQITPVTFEVDARTLDVVDLEPAK